MKSISVYCGSSTGSKGVYMEAAKKLGRTLAQREIQIVFGGGKVGLMGILANAALEAGGKVTGVIPRFLHVKEVAHDGLSDLITADTMHGRKTLIHEMSDAVIALPGGFGTLDELFEMLTWAQLGLHRKPVGILNVNRYFTHLLQAIDTMVDEGFLKPMNREIVLVSENVDELLDKMEHYMAPDIPKWI